LSAIQNGARQIECTINGLGERAGNCALEEVTMAIKTREDYFNFKTDIKTKHLVSASKLVSQITAFAVQPNKAIVGINSFAHESGIHQDGILKHRETYEVMKAEDVGWSTDNQIILGKHSGRHALMEKLKLFCISYDKNDFDEIFKRFKNLADKKHNIYEGDLVSLVSCNNDIVENKIQIEDIKIKSTHSIVEAEVSINENGKIKTHTSTAKGTVNAVFDSINHLLGFKGKLSVYSVNSITEGVEAQGIVNIRVEENGEVFNGTGSHTDILMASASAYINAILSQNSILENNKKETI
jgi:2-isopropylmalate synthase